MSSVTKKRVVIVGAGYGGVALAKKLDSSMHVTLLEKREQFFHNVGSLRAAVDPHWLSKIFIPYTHVLRYGRIVHDTVVKASAQEVQLASGEKLSFDYLVLATGSTYPFPAKSPYNDVASSLRSLHQVSTRIKQAQSILLIGAGPVGIEFAGEIAHVYPTKRVTLIDSSASLLNQFKPQLGERLLAELQQVGVRVLLDEHLQSMAPQTNATTFEEGLTFQTNKGTLIEADLHFTCFGAQATTDYLVSDLIPCRDERGRIRVNQHLQVEGYTHIFALGDVTNINEPKLASVTDFHADVVAENLRRLITSTTHLPKLKVYHPLKAGVLVVPVGPKGGAGQLPILGGLVVGSFATRQIKGKSLLIERYRKALNVGSRNEQ